MERLSAIVTTYNRSGLLRNCIASLERQTRLPDEVIIADDGSDPEHVEVIREIVGSSDLDVSHVRQEHKGFRAGTNRNNGVRRSAGDYLFFVDGDAVLFPDVIEQHLSAAEPGVWVTQYCVLLAEDETERLSVEMIREGRLHELWPEENDKRLRSLRKMYRRFRRKTFWAELLGWDMFRRKIFMSGWSSLHREDFEKVNGFDENFAGWGREDNDLGLRLLIAGVRGRSVILKARAFHQWHVIPPPEAWKSRGRPTTRNRGYFDRRRHGRFRCEWGLDNPKDPASPAGPAKEDRE